MIACSASLTPMHAEPSLAIDIPKIETKPIVRAYTQSRYKNSNPGPFKEMLLAIATEKGLSKDKVIQIEHTIGGDGVNKVCPNGESGWNSDAVGDSGRSFGLAQIHLPAHPHITSAQAKDPKFALNFIVDEFKKGNQWKWTCWRAIYGVKKV